MGSAPVEAGRAAAYGGAHDHAPRGRPMKQLLLVAAAVIAAVVLTQLLFEFYEWNKLQECAAAGLQLRRPTPTARALSRPLGDDVDT